MTSTTSTHYNNNWVDGFFDLLELALADEDEEAFFNDMYEYAVHAGKHLSRAPYRQPQMTGLEWVQTTEEVGGYEVLLQNV